MAAARQDPQQPRGFWSAITPELTDASLPPTAWRHEPRLNWQIQVYAQLHLLQQLMNALPVCVSYIDDQRCYQYANVTYQDWFGLRPEEMYGHPLESVIGAAAYQVVKPYVDQALAGKPVVYETFLPYQSAGRRFVRGTLVPDCDDGGQVRGYFSLIQDLSDRKAAEQALQLKAAREHAIWLITRRIRQTLELQDILATAVEETRHYLEVDRALILQLTSDQAGEVIQSVTHPNYPMAAEWLHWQRHDLRNHSQTHPRPGNVKILLNLVDDDWGTCLTPWMDVMAAKSAVITPIMQSRDDDPHQGGSQPRDLWGFLIVQTCHTYRQWYAEDAKLLQQVTDQLAIAIQQSNLLAEVRQQSEQLARANRALEEANRQLQDINQQDSLTQLANRRHFDMVLRREWKRLGRTQLPLSLIMFDVDRFKQYNDHHGHPAGDDCLVTVAAACQNVVNRPSDVIARYGGEEFAVILPNTDHAGALNLAEQIRSAVCNLAIVNFATATETIHVTVSLGVASLIPSPEASALTLVEVADQALYQAKQQGRNRVVLGHHLP